MTIIKSTLVPLPLENVDTDQIIPARFLKSTSREGFGENLFRDWRYDKITGEKVTDFVLNAEFIQEKSWLLEKILDVVVVENMRRGRSMIMVLR